MDYYWRHQNKDNIEVRVQDDDDIQKKINTDLMLINNIENNSLYKYILSSRELTPILILDHEGFDETQSNATNLIQSS